jgi:hypothetical protein
MAGELFRRGTTKMKKALLMKRSIISVERLMQQQEV